MTDLDQAGTPSPPLYPLAGFDPWADADTVPHSAEGAAPGAATEGIESSEPHDDGANAYDAPSSLMWEAIPDDPTNPFTYRLRFYDEQGEIVSLPLDPMTLQTLNGAMAEVVRLQRAAMGVPDQVPASRSVAAQTTVPLDRATTAPPDPDPTVLDEAGAGTRVLAWLLRHKILAAMALIVTLCVLYSTVTTSSSLG